MPSEVADEPLHVRVARALGWTDLFDLDGESWLGRCPESMRWWLIHIDRQYEFGTDDSYVPRLDTDWAATGPLIEKYGIALSPAHPWDGTPDWWARAGWEASRRDGAFHVEKGKTPLIAICNLIITTSHHDPTLL